MFRECSDTLRDNVPHSCTKIQKMNVLTDLDVDDSAGINGYIVITIDIPEDNNYRLQVILLNRQQSIKKFSVISIVISFRYQSIGIGDCYRLNRLIFLYRFLSIGLRLNNNKTPKLQQYHKYGLSVLRRLDCVLILNCQTVHRANLCVRLRLE